MTRKARPVPLHPEEMNFRLGAWVEKHLTLVERHGPEWVTVCPACGRSKMAIHVTRKAFQCLSAHCRFKGWHPSKLVAMTLDITERQAREMIAAIGMGIDIGPVAKLSDGNTPSRAANMLPPATLPRVQWALDPEGYDYIRGRGVSEEHIRWFGLGTILSDRSGSKADYALSGRVIFPVWNPIGRMVWWVARATRTSRAKTINMPRSCREEGHESGCVCYHEAWGLPPVAHAATADEVVLGLHLVRPGEPVYIVEGPVDAAVCGPGFVATMRAWVSPQQVALIAASGASEAIVLFDGDKAGDQGLAQALPLLRAAMPARGTTCPLGEDPGSLGRREALSVASQAPRGGIQQLRHSRYMTIAKPSHHPPLQEPLQSHSRAAKEK